MVLEQLLKFYKKNLKKNKQHIAPPGNEKMHKYAQGCQTKKIPGISVTTMVRVFPARLPQFVTLNKKGVMKKSWRWKNKGKTARQMLKVKSQIARYFMNILKRAGCGIGEE